MKALMLTLSIIFGLNFAQAGWRNFDSSLLTDEALIATVEAIGDELANNNHGQRVMNMAYNRARLVRKKLDRNASRVGGVEDATDSDILPLLQDIVTSLDQYSHHKFILYFSKKHLDKTLYKLQNNREVPTEIAILTIDGANPHDFGAIFPGSNLITNFTITNSGNGDAQVIEDGMGLGSPFLFSGTQPQPYPGAFGTCGAIIPAGTSCILSLQYSPLTTGAFAGQLVLQYNDGVEVQSLTKDLLGSTR